MLVDISILNAPLDKIEEYLKPIDYAPYIHMDIMDGIFVKETSFDFNVVKRCSVSYPNAIIETHLMVQDPDNLFQKYRDAGSDYILFHYEIGNIKKRLDMVKKTGAKVGLAINPDTDVKVLVPYLKDIDSVLVMSVYPGRGGQKYIESSTDKLKFLFDYKNENNLHYLINVDGGINEETYEIVKPYCDLAVVGSAITKKENYPQVYLEYTKKFK